MSNNICPKCETELDEGWCWKCLAWIWNIKKS